MFYTTRGFIMKIPMKLVYQNRAVFLNLIHLHLLQVENCDSNSRLVVDEDDNGKFRLERVNPFHGAPGLQPGSENAPYFRLPVPSRDYVVKRVITGNSSTVLTKPCVWISTKLSWGTFRCHFVIHVGYVESAPVLFKGGGCMTINPLLTS